MFSLIFYIIFTSFLFSLFYFVLKNNLDVIFLEFFFVRLTLMQITVFLYFLFILSIFVWKTKEVDFSFSNFQRIFFEYLPPVFFTFLLLSFAFLTFNTNFFQVYVFVLIIFFPEFKSFYQKTWIPQIQNSSFIWHILRFSSGVPFLFFESFVAADFFLNGKFFITLEKSLPWRKGAIFAAQMQTRSLSENSLASPVIVQKFLEVQGRPIRSAEMTKWLADSSKNLVNQGIILPQHGTTSITSGLELQHLYMLLNYQYFEGASFIPTVIPFMNEGFFIVQQTLNEQTLVDLRALSSKNPNFVGLVCIDKPWNILRQGDLRELNPDTVKLLDAFISHKLKLEDWSTQYPETNKLPAYKVDVEDFFAIKSNIAERIQTKTEWDGLTGKSFVSKNSDVLVNKFSPPENESILLKKGKVIDNFKFSPKDPRFKVFCADLIENKGKLAASKSSDKYLPLIENVIQSTLKNKFIK